MFDEVYYLILDIFHQMLGVSREFVDQFVDSRWSRNKRYECLHQSISPCRELCRE